MGEFVTECKSPHCECHGADRKHCDAKLSDAARNNVIAALKEEQDMDAATGVVFCGFSCAMLEDADFDTVGVHFADDRPEAARILDAEGFDHTTGCDTAFDSSHTGAMLCAGYALMEHDDVDS